MAEKHAGGLYMSIGLTLNQLQSDFLAAEQTVKQGVAAINRQQNIVKLRMEADTAGLDAVTDKTKILDVQERSLTQLLDLQRDKLKLTQAAYRDVANSKGANSTAAKNLEAAVERERLAVARLETQLKSLARQKISPEANVADVSNAIDTLEEKLERLNRGGEIVRIRAQVEMEGLDKVADAEKILATRNSSLNQQIELQRERVRLLNENLQDLARTQGETATSTQRATIRLERERLALTRLEREAREVTAAISELNSTEINVSGTASISGGTGGTGGTGGSGGSGGSTVSGGAGDWADLLPFELPTTKVAAFTLAIGALGAAIDSVTNIVTESIDDFRETQKQAYELNLDFNDAEEFLRTLRLGGGDIGDFEGFIRGISDAYVKGEYDDPEFIALRKYGAQITDATGRLKNFKDLTDEVYQAWKQADEAGEGIEFLQLVGGEAGVRDAIQFFKRYEEAMEDAAKILDGNKDNEQWHELERTVNLATVQAEEFKDAIANIFTPAAQVTAEKFFNLFHAATEWLVENKDAIQRWGFIAAEAFDTLSKKISGVTEAISDYLAKAATAPKGTTGNADADKMMSGMAWRYQDFNKNTPWGDKTPWKNFAEASQSYGAAEGIIERAEQKQREFNGEIQEATKSWADFKRADEEATKKLYDGNPLSQYGWQRLERFKDELEDLKIEIEFDDDDYQRALAKLKLWYQREHDQKNYLSPAEETALNDLYAAKSDQIKQERQKKLAEVNDRIQERLKNAADIQYEMTHTAFEKELRDIERWQEAQRKKADTAEEVQAIIAESAAKEAQAFERAMDRIRGKLQSLDDKIFEQEHSQYENDLRRLQQERIRYYEDFQKEGILNEATRAKIEQWYQNAVGKLNQRADESRKTDGDYTKSPEGAIQRGGNGIMVIGADKIIDDGKLNQSIGLFADDSQIFSQQLQKLSAGGRDLAIVNRQLADAQKNLIQSTNQAAGGIQVIEGDKVIDMPQMPTQEFSDDIQLTDPLQALQDSAQVAADAQKSLADSVKNFPPDYFKQLADGTAAVSDMQMLLTNSTMKLIDAQGKLAAALENLPTVNQSRDDNQPTDAALKLNYSTQNLQDAQRQLAVTTRDADNRLRDISDIPPQSRLAQKESGVKFGIDYDTFKDVLLTGVGLAAPAAMTGVGTAAIPTIAVGTLATAITAAVVKGTYDETTAAPDLPDDRLRQLPAETDLSALVAPLIAIDEKAQSILQAVQDAQPYAADSFQELFGALPNIEAGVQDILLALQARADSAVTPPDSLQTPSPELQAHETNISFDTIVTPLNNIAGLVQNILTALGNRQPPQITVSPNNSINLGGAYVFDNEMKRSLVDDITNRIVSEITSAVQQATSRSSYGYGA